MLDPDLFRSEGFRFGATGQMLQQIALGGTMIVPRATPGWWLLPPLVTTFRMMRLPDPESAGAGGGTILGWRTGLERGADHLLEVAHVVGGQ